MPPGRPQRPERFRGGPGLTPTSSQRRTLPLREFLRLARLAGCDLRSKGGNIIVSKPGVRYMLTMNGRACEVGPKVVSRACKYFGLEVAP